MCGNADAAVPAWAFVLLRVDQGVDPAAVAIPTGKILRGGRNGRVAERLDVKEHRRQVGMAEMNRLWLGEIGAGIDDGCPATGRSLCFGSADTSPPLRSSTLIRGQSYLCADRSVWASP